MDFLRLLREARQMQEKAREIERSIADMTCEGSAGGGVVRSTVSGAGDLRSITIAPEVVDPSDIPMLEDLVVAAVRNAQDNARALRHERTGALVDDLRSLGIPGLDDLEA